MRCICLHSILLVFSLFDSLAQRIFATFQNRPEHLGNGHPCCQNVRQYMFGSSRENFWSSNSFPFVISTEAKMRKRGQGAAAGSKSALRASRGTFSCLPVCGLHTYQNCWCVQEIRSLIHQLIKYRFRSRSLSSSRACTTWRMLGGFVLGHALIVSIAAFFLDMCAVDKWYNVFNRWRD